MKDFLIILTSNFPYRDVGSDFEKQEILILSKKFKKIYVICDSKKNDTFNYNIPENVILLSKERSKNNLIKYLAIGCVFNKIVFNELVFIIETLKIKLNKTIIAILLIEFLNAKITSRYISQLIKKEKINTNSLLLYTFWNDYRAIALSLLKLKNSKLVAVSRAHRGDIYFEENSENYLPLKQLILKNINGLFCVSKDIKYYLEKKLNSPLPNIYVSYLGTFNNHCSLISNKKNDLNTFNIYSCSNIIERKRVNLIAESISLITLFSIFWNHIGGDYMEGVVKNITNNLFKKTSHKYNFHGGLENKDLFSLYATTYVDLFVNTSKSEGLPVSIMEAMSFGIPVIATNVGGTSEIVKDGFNGFLLSENPSPEEVSEIITKFYFLSEKEKIIMRNNAYNTWNSAFNAEKNYTAFIENILSF